MRMEDGREAYRRGSGHSRLHSYEGPASPREQFYGGPLRDNREVFRRPSYGFTSPLGRAGNFIGPSGPVSPDRERLRGYSPERRPYSPEDDRRAYSPERPDRERAQRYQMQERTNGYRPREEGFRRDVYGYRGDDSRSVHSRDPSPDHHHSLFHNGRDQVQSLRDRGPDHDTHPRVTSREGTPLDSWGIDRISKLQVMPPMPLQGNGNSRGGLRGGSNSSGSIRGTGIDYPENVPVSGDLEAGEVAPVPGLRIDQARPSPDQHHMHHHSSHHHHHSSYHGHHSLGHGNTSGAGPGNHGPHRSSAGALFSVRGNGSSGGWESKAAGSGSGAGVGTNAVSKEGLSSREGGRDSTGRDPNRDIAGNRGDGGARDPSSRDARDAGQRDPRENTKHGYRSSSLSSGQQQPQSTRDSQGRLEAGPGRDCSLSGRDRDREHRERERERDRERDRGATGSVPQAARSSSQGVPVASPGQSPRLTASDTAAAQAPSMVSSGEVQQSPAVKVEHGQDGIRTGEKLPAPVSLQQQRWGSASAVAGQQQHQPSSQPQGPSEYCLECGAPAPSAASGGVIEALQEGAGGLGGAAMNRKASNAAAELERWHSSGTAVSGFLDRKPCGSSSHGQTLVMDALIPLARMSTAGTALSAVDSSGLATIAAHQAAALAAAPVLTPVADAVPALSKRSESADRRHVHTALTLAAGDGQDAGAATVVLTAEATTPSPGETAAAPLAALSFLPIPVESRPNSTAGAVSGDGTVAAVSNGIHVVASVNSLCAANPSCGATATKRSTSCISAAAVPEEMEASRAPIVSAATNQAAPLTSTQKPPSCVSHSPASGSANPYAAGAISHLPSVPQQLRQQSPQQQFWQRPMSVEAEAHPASFSQSFAANGGIGGESATVSAANAPRNDTVGGSDGPSERPLSANFAGTYGHGGPMSGPAVAVPPSSGTNGGGDDSSAIDRRISLGIRRFGFGRARRSMPAKSAGEAPAEDGELHGGASLERTPSGTVRPPPQSELPDPEAATAVVTAQADGRELNIQVPALAVPETVAATPTAIANAISTPMGFVAQTPLFQQPTPAAAASTPGGIYIPHGSYTPQYGTSLHFQLSSPLSGRLATPGGGVGVTPGATAVAAATLVVAAQATRSTSSLPSGSGAAPGAGGCIPMEVDSHNASLQDAVCRAQQHPGTDAAGSGRNSAETVAGLSLRIEHLETEITDLERQLSELVAESRQAKTEAVELATEVGALEEQLLEDSSDDDCESDDTSGTPVESKSSQPEIDEEAEPGCVDRSGGSVTSASGVQVAPPVPKFAAAAIKTMTTIEVPVSESAQLPTYSREGQDEGHCTASIETETEGVENVCDEDSDDPVAGVKLQDSEDPAGSAATVAPMKPRGRPRSSAKMRAAEAAAVAAAAADNRRKALEHQNRIPADGLLHLSALKFRPRYMDCMRRAASNARVDVLRLLPDSLAERVRAAVEAGVQQQARMASTAPAPGHGRWAVMVPSVPVRVEPLYREPQDIHNFHANNERHTFVRDAVGRYLRQRRQLVTVKQNVLVEQYSRNMASYKQYIQTEGRRPTALPSPLPTTGRGAATATSLGMYGASRAVNSYNPYAYSHSDVIRSDLDEHRLLNNFLAVEQLKYMCALPDMVLDPWERRWRAYDNRNGLVQNPVRELEEERMIKSWADDERALFMDKFLQHPKDFRKISTYLPGRSPGDCVAFFYKNQKLDDFSTVRRKQQLKKRRLQTDMRKQQYAPLLMAPMIARQRTMGQGGGGGPGDITVRAVRGRMSSRGGPPGRGRSSNALDAEAGLSMGQLSYVGSASSGGLSGSLGVPRSLPSGGMPGLQSMIAAAQRAAAASATNMPLDLVASPNLPPISSPVSAQPQAALPASGNPPSGPSATGWTDEDFVECYRQHGKCWEAYCRVLGMRTESAAKQYFYRHKDRLGLYRISPIGGVSGGGGDAPDAGVGLTSMASANVAGPSRKAFLAARLANEESAAPGLLAAATAAAAMANAAAAAAANIVPQTTTSATSLEELGTGRAVAGSSPLQPDDSHATGLGLLASVSRREAQPQYHSPSPTAPQGQPQTSDDVSAQQPHVQMQVQVQVLEQARAQAQAEAQAAAQAQVYHVLDQVRTQAPPVDAPSPATQKDAQAQQQTSVHMLSRPPVGRRRGPPRVPPSASSLSNGPHSNAPSLESNEILRQDNRYKQKFDGDLRSDSEYEPVGGVGSGSAVGSADSLLPQLDFLAALRNPGSSSLSQLLAGGLLQPGGGGSAVSASSAGATASSGGGSGKGIKGGNAPNGGQLDVFGQLLLQQREQQREVRDTQHRDQQTGGFGALTALGLNLGVLGGLAGVLQGGMGAGGTPGGLTISLFTGQSTGAQMDDPSAGQFSPVGDDGSGGGAGGGQAGGRRGANYWSDEERNTFMQVFSVHGRNWDILCQAIPTKTLSQIKTYFHNYKIRLGFDKMDVPPNTAQPTCRRGQGARAIRDAAAAANVATMAAVSASGRGYDDVYGEEDHPRPAKRQATGQGPVQSSGLELGSLAGDVSPSHGDGSGGGTSPVLPPVMDLQALAHAYGGGVQMSPHLLLRDRDHDLTGASGGGGAASNAPATTKALLQLLRSLSELKGGPALGGASGNQGHTSREGDEGLTLNQSSLGALGGPMQLHSLHLPGGHGSSVATVLFPGSAQQQAHASQQLQQHVPVKLQTLNLESLIGPVDRDRDRVREREREGTAVGAGANGSLLLQDVGLPPALVQQLQLHALTERNNQREREREQQQQPPPQQQQADAVHQELPLSPERLSATVAELLANIVHQNPHQQQQQGQHAQYGLGSGLGASTNVKQPTSQALDLAAPPQSSTLSLDVQPSPVGPSGFLAALAEATAGSSGGLGAGGGGSGGGDMTALTAAAGPGGGSGSCRSARAGGETGSSSGSGVAPLSIHMLLHRETWSDRQGDGKALPDSDIGEPVPKRQKHVSKDVAQQGLDLGLPPGLVTGGRAGEGGPTGRLLLGDEQVAQHLLLQLHQQQQQQVANALSGGSVGLRTYQQLREPRCREQQQRSTPAASCNPVQPLNLGPLAGGLLTSAGNSTGGGTVNGSSGNVLRLMPLQSAPAQHQQQQEAGNVVGGGAGGVPRIPIGGPVSSQVVVGSQGQAVTLTELLSSLGAGRGLGANGQGGGGSGAFGVGGLSVFGLERLLASAQEAGEAPFMSMQQSTATPGAGAWLGQSFREQLASSGPRPLSLNVLVQTQQQQQQGEK